MPRPATIARMKILIVGDSGRGKTTFAKSLGQKLALRVHSTDDIFWKVKFSEEEDPEVRMRKIKEIYASSEWIVEGSGESLLEPGFEKADLIYYLHFPNVVVQFFVIIRRFLEKKEGSVKHLLMHLRHNLYKRYKLGYKKDDPNLREKLAPFWSKVVILDSYKAVQDALKKY